MPNTRCMTRRFASALLSLTILGGGCTATKVAQEQAARAEARNAELQTENARLQTELEQQEQLSARLQMELVRKQVELARIAASRQGRPAETRSTLRAPAAGTRTETVAYVAAVTAEVESARPKRKTGDPDMLRADQLLAESNRELEADRYQQAAQRASKALAQVNRARGSVETAKVETVSADFRLPFALKVTAKSSVRQSPDLQGRAVATLESDTSVTALGHKGGWIRVALQDGREGWLEYSQLALPGNGDKSNMP